MLKIAIAALVCALAACAADSTSELGRPCADDPCDPSAPGLRCVTFAAPVGDEPTVCSLTCASPETAGQPCDSAAGSGVCAVADIVGGEGASMRTWCMPACEEEGGAAVCPVGLYPRSSGASCACLP